MQPVSFLESSSEEHLVRSLTGLGFSRNEAVVYVALVKNGRSLIGAIASATGMHRQLLYQSLEGLEKQGLLEVEETPQGRVFAACDIHSLDQIVAEEREITDRLVPKLEKIHLQSPSGLQVKVLHNKAGLIESLYDILTAAEMSSDRTMRIISGTKVGVFWETLVEFDQEYLAMSKQKKIKKLLISKEDYPAKLRATLFSKSSGNKMRTLSEGLTTPGSTRITQNMVAIELYYPRPLVIQIHSKVVAAAYVSTFNALWKSASVPSSVR